MISNDRFTTYSSNKIIKFYDLNVWNVLEDLCGHEDKVWCIDKLNNYRIFCCSSDKAIRVWDLNTGECLKLSSCSSDKTIKIWDIDDVICLKTLNFHWQCLFLFS